MDKIFKFLLASSLLFICSLFSTAHTLAEDVYDPIEPANRGVFWVNDKFDRWILSPLADTYDFLLPNFAQKSVRNFFLNLRYPSYLISDLIQLKFKQAGSHSARFLLNSTIGAAGLLDVATDWGFPDHYEDFGTALGHYGIGTGPYLVLPLLGPSNVRDGIGEVVDVFLNPLFYVGSLNLKQREENAIQFGLLGLNFVQTRDHYREAIDSARAASLDFYIFSRQSYAQLRNNQISDGTTDAESEIELLENERFEDDEE